MERVKLLVVMLQKAEFFHIANTEKRSNQQSKLRFNFCSNIHDLGNVHLPYEHRYTLLAEVNYSTVPCASINIRTLAHPLSAMFFSLWCNSVLLLSHTMKNKFILFTKKSQRTKILLKQTLALIFYIKSIFVLKISPIAFFQNM